MYVVYDAWKRDEQRDRKGCPEYQTNDQRGAGRPTGILLVCRQYAPVFTVKMFFWFLLIGFLGVDFQTMKIAERKNI